MARFLRETIDEGVMATRGKDSINTTEFIDFFINLRSSDKPVNIDKLLAIAKKFEDELTLDNLSRPQLLSMCRYMNINTFGTDNFLRYKLRNRMWQIKADDRLIAAEGVEELTPTELAHACTSRGLRTVGVSEEEQRAALRLWLNLHLEQKLPTTLLVLTYAFALLARTKSAPEALQATLSSLPDKLVNEAHLKVSEEAGVATPKQRLDVIKEQEELIEDERERSRLEEEAAVRIAEGASASDEVTADETTTASTADIPEGKVLVNQDEAHPTLTASPSMTDDKDTLHAKETKLHA
jgi:LETM1 and EF-hand domain-containing protein 1